MRLEDEVNLKIDPEVCNVSIDVGTPSIKSDVSMYSTAKVVKLGTTEKQSLYLS